MYAFEWQIWFYIPTWLLCLQNSSFEIFDSALNLNDIHTNVYLCILCNLMYSNDIFYNDLSLKLYIGTFYVSIIDIQLKQEQESINEHHQLHTNVVNSRLWVRIPACLNVASKNVTYVMSQCYDHFLKRFWAKFSTNYDSFFSNQCFHNFFLS
jgi:hypothetical protein